MTNVVQIPRAPIALLQGETVTFRVKPTTKFSKIIKAFCQKEGLDESGVRFMFDGERLNPDDTPAGHDMEDGDQVDVTTVAVGGRRV